MSGAEFDVFLSYTHADLEPVADLHRRLEARGLRVFRDEHAIATFDSISERLAVGLARSKVLVAYYSQRYPTRRACQWELTRAFVAAGTSGRPADRVLVVNPVRDADGVPSVDHIVPTQLRDRLMTGDDLEASADAIAATAATVDTALGEATVPRPPHHGRPLVPSPRFTDRYETLWALHAGLHAHEDPIVSDAYVAAPVVLWATGGMGKSLAVEEYALRFGGLYPGGVYWLSAAGDQLTTAAQAATQRASQYRSLAEEVLGTAIVAATSPDEALTRLFRAAELAGPSLWVIDDLAVGLDDDEYRAWLPQVADAQCVVTTRGRYPQGRDIDLHVLVGQDALDLLTSRVEPSGDDEHAAAHEVVGLLGGHAMALDIAAENIRYEGDAAPFRSYAQRISDPEYGIEALDEVSHALPNGHEPSILATFGGAIGRLGDDARELLAATSLLAADTPIGIDLLRAAGTGLWSDEPGAEDGGAPVADPRTVGRVTKALAECDRHALMSRLPDGTWTVHRLVAQTAAAGLDERASAAARDAIARGVATTLWTLKRQPRPSSPMAHGRWIAQTVDSRATGKLANALSRAEFDHGAYDVARAWADRALSYADEHLEPVDPDRLSAVAQRSNALWGLGDYEASRSLIEEVAVAREQVLGPNHPDTLSAKSNLAAVLAGLGHYPEAHALDEEVLSAREKHLGVDHPDTLMSKNNLASSLEALGRYPEARRLREEVLARREALLGPDHPDTLESKNSMAISRSSDGDHVAARDLDQEVLSARERILGPDHPDTLTSKNNLAISLSNLGDHEAAHALHEQVLAERRRTLGPRHPATLTSENNLATSLASLGDLEAAHALHEEVLAERGALLGADHPDSLVSKVNVANSLEQLGDHAGARDLYREVLAEREASLGPDHPDTADAKSRLATTLQRLGDWEGAAALGAPYVVTIPLEAADGERVPSPFTIGPAVAGTHPLAAQAKIYRERGLTVPAPVMESFQKLADIALENDVELPALVRYALEEADGD